MDELEDFSGCTIKCGCTKMTLEISQPYLVNNMNQGFNKDIKSLMTFNTSSTPHKVIVHKQENTRKYHTIYRRDTGVA